MLICEQLQYVWHCGCKGIAPAFKDLYFSQKVKVAYFKIGACTQQPHFWHMAVIQRIEVSRIA